MSDSPITFTPDTRVRDLYIEWIENEKFNKQYAKKWAHQYNNDPEAAMCEATFWGVLQDCGVQVEPNEDLTGQQQSPDFCCHKNGKKFYVEVTCMRIARVSEATSLSHLVMSQDAQRYANLNDAIFQEVINKTPQCKDLDAPALLAIGTFHFQASCLCIQKKHVEMLLTGEQMISLLLDMRCGQTMGEPFLSTKLKSATFLKPAGKDELQEARLPVSGILLGGFGCNPPNVCGLLHPKPVRSFDSTLLDRIGFCQLSKRSTPRSLEVEWV